MTDYEIEMQRRAAFQARLPELTAQPAAESADRVAFIRSLPLAPVTPDDAPGCHCGTFTLWRHGTERWRCFACDPPPNQDGIEVVRATIPGRPVWNEALRRWEQGAA